MTLVTPNPEELRGVLASLNDLDDEDFPDVSLVHVSGWIVTIDNNWVAVLERVHSPDEALKVAQLEGEEEAVAMWLQLARGDVEGLLERWAWKVPE
jgi:hypothetical protein